MDYYYSRRYKEAVETFQLKAAKGQADKNDPMLIGKAYYSLAMASRSPQDIDNADAAFSKIVADDPGNIEAHSYLARSVSLRDPESKQGLAAPRFESMIIQIGPETEKYKQALFEAYSYLGYHNLQKKDYETSRSWYEKLFSLDTKNKEWQIRALQSMALTCYREKNYISAREYYQRILLIDPNNADAKKAVNDLTTVINAAKKT
jgi:tetratricopeptide (TPR) repeat protein